MAKIEIDQRTGEEYVGKDWGHGLECLCFSCVSKTLSDMVEAGLMEIVGFDDDGQPRIRFKEDESGKDEAR